MLIQWKPWQIATLAALSAANGFLLGIIVEAKWMVG